AFFSQGGGVNPRLTYTLRPNLAAGQVILLQLDGQAHEFSAGASSIQHAFTWPASSQASQEAVGRTGSSADFNSSFSSHHEGPWSVFHLFADAEPRNINDRSLEWRRTRGPSGDFSPIKPTVKLEFTGFPGGADIFNPKYFESFKCPLKATQ